MRRKMGREEERGRQRDGDQLITAANKMQIYPGAVSMPKFKHSAVQKNSELHWLCATDHFQTKTDYPAIMNLYIIISIIIIYLACALLRPGSFQTIAVAPSRWHKSQQQRHQRAQPQSDNYSSPHAVATLPPPSPSSCVVINEPPKD